jgi:hypothetical protein
MPDYFRLMLHSLREAAWIECVASVPLNADPFPENRFNAVLKKVCAH